MDSKVSTEERNLKVSEEARTKEIVTSWMNRQGSGFIGLVRREGGLGSFTSFAETWCTKLLELPIINPEHSLSGESMVIAL